jgi:hypothetical protein
MQLRRSIDVALEERHPELRRHRVHGLKNRSPFGPRQSRVFRLREERWELSPEAQSALSQFLERYLVDATARGNSPTEVPPAPVEPEPPVVPPDGPPAP